MYNIVYIVSIVYNELFRVWKYVILYAYTLRHVVIDNISTVGSVYINRKLEDRYNDLEQGPEAWEFYKLY